MSVHIIYYQDGAKMMRPVASETEYRMLRNTPQQCAMVEMARGGDQNAKRRLVQFNYSLAPTAPSLPPSDPSSSAAGDAASGMPPQIARQRFAPEGGVNGVPLKGCTQISTSVGMDVDLDKSAPDYEQKMKNIPARVLAKKDELGLLMLERSASKGYHIVFRRHTDMTQEQNLRWASDLLGVQYDEGAKDITRVFFATTASEEDLIYINEELFDNEACHPERNAVESKDPTPTLPSTPAELAGDSSTTAEASAQNDGMNKELLYNPSPLGEKEGAIPFSLIIQEWWNLTNNGQQPVKSNRDALTYELAVNLRNICGFDRNVLNQVIPCYDGFPEAEKMKCIDSALQSARTQMPSRLKMAIANAKAKASPNPSEGGEKEDNNLFSFLRGETPPERPKRLPSVLALLTSNVAERQVATTAMSVFPALGVHLSGVTIRDTDNVSLEPAFMHLQIARSSSGKSCINKPIDMIIADIREADRKARDERREWVRTCKKLGANKEKPPRPTSIVQLADINMTAAALTQMLFDADMAGGKGLYTRMDEIEMLSDLGAGSNLSGARGVSKILRLGYDHAEWGQERVGVDSVCERAPLRWFWNASGTIQRCHSYLSTSIADGTLSRLTLSTILDRGPRPIYGNYGKEFAEKLKPYILRLTAANGEVRCEQAERVARRLSEEITMYLDTLLEDDDVVSSWAPRAATMALMRAIVLYIAEGYTWSKEIENFMIWSYEYDLWCKYHFFGEDAEREMNAEVVAGPRKRGPHGVLSQMPATFTLEELKNKMTELDCSAKPQKIITTWKARKLISVDSGTGIIAKL